MVRGGWRNRIWRADGRGSHTCSSRTRAGAKCAREGDLIPRALVEWTTSEVRSTGSFVSSSDCGACSPDEACGDRWGVWLASAMRVAATVSATQWLWRRHRRSAWPRDRVYASRVFGEPCWFTPSDLPDHAPDSSDRQGRSGVRAPDRNAGIGGVQDPGEWLTQQVARDPVVCAAGGAGYGDWVVCGGRGLPGD